MRQALKHILYLAVNINDNGSGQAKSTTQPPILSDFLSFNVKKSKEKFIGGIPFRFSISHLVWQQWCRELGQSGTSRTRLKTAPRTLSATVTRLIGLAS